MADRDYQPGEVTARGDAIYRDQILPRPEPMPKGTFVVIDIESGDYEIDGRDAAATKRLLQRRPSAVTHAGASGLPSGIPTHWRLPDPRPPCIGAR